MGVCLLDVVRRQNFVNCFGLGKATYAICQSHGSWNGGFVGFSHHDNSQYNATNYNGNMNAVILMLKQGWNFKEGDILMIKVNYEESVIEFCVLNLKYE